MGWGQGIGIGWPNASAQATPPPPPGPTYEYSLTNNFTTRIKPMQSGYTINNNFLLENLTEANERGLVYGGEGDDIYFEFDFMVGQTIADPVHPVNVYYRTSADFYYNQDEFPFTGNCPIENSNIVVDRDGGFRAIKLLNISNSYSYYRINGDFLTLNYSPPTPYIVNTYLEYEIENAEDEKQIYIYGESYSTDPDQERGVVMGAGDAGLNIQFTYHYIVLKDDGEGGEFVEEGYADTNNFNLSGSYAYGNSYWGYVTAGQGGNVVDWYLFEIVDVRIMNNNNQNINGEEYYLSTNSFTDIWSFDFNF